MQELQRVGIDGVVGGDAVTNVQLASLLMSPHPLDERQAGSEVLAHPRLHLMPMTHAVPHHIEGVVCLADTMGVHSHIRGSLSITALAHKHTVDKADGVKGSCCRGCHHVVARAAIDVGMFCFRGNIIEQRAAQHLAMSHHRSIEEADEIAVGTARIVAHLGTALREGHGSAYAHHHVRISHRCHLLL